MRFAVYLPPQCAAAAAAAATRVPVVLFLSGLTCTEENFTVKAGAQRAAARLGVALVAPDTSPRGLNLPGDADAWDFGVGAGFYVDATREPWSAHYRMYSYVLDELVGGVLRTSAPFAAVLDMERVAISGHSMGGHGALVLALRNPQVFRSVSAFAPIVAPTRVPWGRKAFAGYLGSDDEAAWRAYDSCELVRSLGWPHADAPIMIDQGTADKFLEEQLRPELFAQAAAEKGVPVRLRMLDGYDHSYYFIASFVEEHLEHHAKVLAGAGR